MKTLIGVLLVAKVAFAVQDNVYSLKLLERGFRRQVDTILFFLRKALTTRERIWLLSQYFNCQFSCWVLFLLVGGVQE